jgi:UDP-glucose 4-epimerase
MLCEPGRKRQGMGIPILVSGGAGYVGAHTCKALAGAGYTPITYDNLSTGHAEFVRWGPLIRADIGDAATVSICMRLGLAYLMSPLQS